MANPKHVMSAGEIADLEAQRSELNSTLKAVGEYGEGTSRRGMVDTSGIKREIEAIDRKIEEGQAPKVSGKAKDALAEEARALEEKIKEGMPTRDELWAKRGEAPGIARKQLNWELRNASNIARWKQIKRRLEAGDPTCSNIEMLRKAK